MLAPGLFFDEKYLCKDRNQSFYCQFLRANRQIPRGNSNLHFLNRDFDGRTQFFSSLLRNDQGHVMRDWRKCSEPGRRIYAHVAIWGNVVAFFALWRPMLAMGRSDRSRGNHKDCPYNDGYGPTTNYTWGCKR